MEKIKAIQSLNGLGEAGKISAAEFNVQNLSAYAAAVSDLTAKQQAAALASAGLTKAQIEEAMAKNGVDKANIQLAFNSGRNRTDISKSSRSGSNGDINCRSGRRNYICIWFDRCESRTFYVYSWRCGSTEIFNGV